MKQRNEKIAAFIEKIGSPGLEGESQSALLPTTFEAIGGDNGGDCINYEDSCRKVKNGGNCKNYNRLCGKAVNKGTCLNTADPAPPSIVDGGVIAVRP